MIRLIGISTVGLPVHPSSDGGEAIWIDVMCHMQNANLWLNQSDRRIRIRGYSTVFGFSFSARLVVVVPGWSSGSPTSTSNEQPRVFVRPQIQRNAAAQSSQHHAISVSRNIQQRQRETNSRLENAGQTTPSYPSTTTRQQTLVLAVCILHGIPDGILGRSARSSMGQQQHDSPDPLLLSHPFQLPWEVETKCIPHYLRGRRLLLLDNDDNTNVWSSSYSTRAPSEQGINTATMMSAQQLFLGLSKAILSNVAHTMKKINKKYAIKMNRLSISVDYKKNSIIRKYEE
jgi:hypothetical protein